MKKKILFSILLVCLLMVGCGKKSSTKQKEESNNNNTNVVTAGDSIDIKLDSNSSTGYSWTYDLSGDDVVTLTHSYEEGENCEGLDGCGGQEIFTVTATGAGEVEFNLSYVSVTGETTAYEANYIITIDDDLKITETHSGSYFTK